MDKDLIYNEIILIRFHIYNNSTKQHSKEQYLNLLWSILFVSVMISLQDKIIKFQKLLYNKQLDDFIPIDEQFIGGGITMESLIKENSFIIQEIKKMKNVFVNYCKLNNTVYEKITEHEISLHTSNQKMNDLSHTVETKLNQSISQFKNMFQQLQYQSQRTKILVQQAVRPIQQAIKLKVDESSFAVRMQKLIYQLGDAVEDYAVESQAGSEGTSLNNNPLASDGKVFVSEDGTIIRRKPKNVTKQEFLHEKQKNSNILMHFSQKIEELETQLKQNDALIYKNTSNMNKIILQIDKHQNQMFRLNRDCQQNRSSIISTEEKLSSEIAFQTSDSVWQKKLRDFQTIQINPIKDDIYRQINQYQKKNQKSFNNLQPRFSQLVQKNQLMFNESQEGKKIIKKVLKSIQGLQKKFDDQIIEVQNKIQIIDKENNRKIQKTHQKINFSTQIISNQIQSLSKAFQDLSKTLEDKILFGVKKNFQSKLHEIDKNIHNLSVKQKSFEDQMLMNRGEIHNIKEVLSKKANFTDILLQFQKKADRQDFKQLKDKIDTSTPSYLKSTALERQTPQKSRRTISANSRKRTSMSRNLLLQNDDKSFLDIQNEKSSRMFIMGLDSEIMTNADRRRLSYTECNKRKNKIKSMGGGINMLANNWIEKS